MKLPDAIHKAPSTWVLLTLALGISLSTSGCAVVTVAGAATGAVISVTGAVISTTVGVAGKVVEKTIDVVTPSGDEN